MSNNSHANDSNFIPFFINLHPWILDYELFPWLNIYNTLIFTFNILRFINRKNNQTEIVIIIGGCFQRNRHDAYPDAWKNKIFYVCKCKTFLSSVVLSLHFRPKSNKNNMIKNDNGLERLDEGRFVLQGNHTAFSEEVQSEIEQVFVHRLAWTLTVLFSLGMGFRWICWQVMKRKTSWHTPWTRTYHKIRLIGKMNLTTSNKITQLK